MAAQTELPPEAWGEWGSLRHVGTFPRGAGLALLMCRVYASPVGFPSSGQAGPSVLRSALPLVSSGLMTPKDARPVPAYSPQPRLLVQGVGLAGATPETSPEPAPSKVRGCGSAMGAERTVLPAS